MKALTVQEVRELEAHCGVPGFELMERAGAAIADFINARRKQFRRVVFLCGKGNNAGDAICAAAKTQLPSVLYFTDFPARLTGEAAQALRHYRANLHIEPAHKLSPVDLRPGDLVVDALLGIGYDGAALRGAIADYIPIVNAAHLPVLSLDIPSGISGDHGFAAPGGAIRATWTLALGFPKAGLFRGAGVAHRGVFQLADIGMGSGDSACGEEVYTVRDTFADLPRPDVFTHKKSRGVAAIFAGSAAYSGAAALCSEAALRGGAGLVKLFSSVRPAQLARAVIYAPTTKVADLSDVDVILAGPGWGEEASPEVLAKLWAFPGKLVLDADALNLLARDPDLWRQRDQLIITPHPGEAGRLEQAFNLPAGGDDRIGRAVALAQKLHAVVVFKGKDTVIAAPDGAYSLNSSGDWRLATAGSGDVLAGVIAGIWAQSDSAWTSARLATFIHGRAAETLAGFPIADDLLPALAQVFEQLALGVEF